MIYADNAATTKLDLDAFEAMQPFLLGEYGNASQPYSFANEAKRALNTARKTIADCIGAFPDEIYFTSGGTESDNWAIREGMKVKGGNIVASCIEHKAVLNTCRALAEDGREVRYIPVDNYGVINTAVATELIDKQTSIVSVMLANNEVGSIQPIGELIRAAHLQGALFHTDAVQAVAHISIDVKEMGVDLLSASAHKFNGPKGIGFLYVRRGIKISPYIIGGAQENNLRAGTENIASIVAMAKALEINMHRLQDFQKKMYELEKILLERLRAAKLDFKVNGSSNKIPGNISISIKNAEGEVLLHRLDIRGICVSTGAACDSKKTQISHVLKQMHVPEEYALGTVRISLGYENTEKDVITIGNELINIINQGETI